MRKSGSRHNDNGEKTSLKPPSRHGDEDVHVPVSLKGETVPSEEVLSVFAPDAGVISLDATQQPRSKITAQSHIVASASKTRHHEDAYSMKSSLRPSPRDADDDAEIPVTGKGDTVSSKEDLLVCAPDASVVPSDVAQ